LAADGQPVESLDEFGIPRLGGSGLFLREDLSGDMGADDDNNNNNNGNNHPTDQEGPEFVMLPRLSRGPTWGAAPNLDGTN
jgi:hypothetical protein